MTKLRILSVALAVLAVASFISGCTKSKTRTFQVLDNDSAVIKHFEFKPGSYWIYQDAFSGRVDSFYVRNNYYTNLTETYNILQYHFITIAELNMDGRAPGDSADWVFNYQANDIMLDYDYTYSTATWGGWQYEIQFRPLVFYPFDTGTQHGLYDTAKITQIDSALIINGQVYTNVAHVYHSSHAGTSEGPNITTLTDMFYINDSVGLIEMTLNHPLANINRDWQLVRYKLVK